MKPFIWLSVIAVTLSGCAALFEGTTQEITINTNPSGADCSLNRKGTAIGRINPTPGAVTIKKTKEDITVICNKAGYQQASFLNHSDVDGVTVADVIGGVLTGGIAWGIDSASGADNKYDSAVTVSLVPIIAGTATSAPGPTASATGTPAAGATPVTSGAVAPKP